MGTGRKKAVEKKKIDGLRRAEKKIDGLRRAMGAIHRQADAWAVSDEQWTTMPMQSPACFRNVFLLRAREQSAVSGLARSSKPASKENQQTA